MCLKLTPRQCKYVNGNKNGSAKIKTNRLNDDACNNAINWPVSLNNEATPYNAVFSGAAPTSTSATDVASTIVPDAHIPPSGQKQHTKPFYPVNMKKVAQKYTLGTTPAPYAPTATTADASSRYPGLVVSNSPYSLRNRNFPTSSIKTKKKRLKLMINLLSTVPLPPTIFMMFS